MASWLRSTMPSPGSAGCCRPCRLSAGCRVKILRRIDAAESIPESGSGARHQYLQITLLLELTVDRNARQRGQIVAVCPEQDARPRRHCGLESKLGGNAKLAGPGGGRIAHGKGQM